MAKTAPLVSARKKPRQARSTQVVDDILEAAIRVLLSQGGARFTTVRVAEEAGVSVGSLYQYFPNKTSLLFRLQADEWVETWTVLEEILKDDTRAPFDRLRRAVLAFFRSERQEAPLRIALDATGAPFRESPEAAKHLERAFQTFREFLDEAIPHASSEKKRFTAEFLMVSMGSVAEEITRRNTSRTSVDAFAKTSAEMYCSYLGTLDERERVNDER